MPQRVLALAYRLVPSPRRIQGRPVSPRSTGSVQLICGEALLSSVILGILLTLAVGSVRMLQLRRLAKRPPVVERRRRGRLSHWYDHPRDKLKTLAVLDQTDLLSNPLHLPVDGATGR